MQTASDSLRTSLTVGMVFALETQHGKVHEFGVRLEEMLIVTETGYEAVSTYKSHEIVAVD